MNTIFLDVVSGEIRVRESFNRDWFQARMVDVVQLDQTHVVTVVQVRAVAEEAEQ